MKEYVRRTHRGSEPSRVTRCAVGRAARHTLGPAARRLLRAGFILLFVYFLYALFAGALIFAWNPQEPLSEEQAASYRAGLRATGEDTSASVSLVEGNTFAGLARVDLLRRATQTLEISSHQITGGKAADVFFAEVLDAADRGVEVRIILDGVFEGMRRLADGLEEAILAHPNIRVAFYEPYDVFRPWSIQNRFHDKVVIVDGEMLLTGGRNIGSRYFLYELEDNSRISPLRDRDVLVFSADGIDAGTVPRAVAEAQDYFETVWTHEYTEEQRSLEYTTERVSFTEGHIEESRARVDEILGRADADSGSTDYTIPVAWEERAIPAETVRFFTNPLERMNKTPTVFRTLAAFLDGAQEEAWIQSPFIVTNSNMETILGEFPRENQVLLTNAPATNPNWFATSGYLNQRETVARNSRALYEYQGSGSIHAKAWLIDGRYSFIGAFNVDPRSAFLSTESMLFIESEEFGRKHAEAMEQLAERSLAIRSSNGDLTAVPRDWVEAYETGSVKRTALRVMQVLARPLAFLL